MNNFRCILVVLVFVKTIFCSEKDILKYIQCENQQFLRASTGCCTDANGKEHKYNRAEEICCGNRLDTRKKYYECCIHSGKRKYKMYHVKREICCNGEVLDRLDSTNTVCCGNATYDQRHEYCIEGLILPMNESICNGERYNVHKYHCCNGELTGQKKTSGNACCGHKLMVINDEICCENEIQRKNINTHCCGKKAIRKNLSCCNGIEYNPTSHRCINGKITNSSISICYSTLFNEKTQVCCKYSVINKTEDKQDSCCQGSFGPKIPYNSKRQICTVKGDVKSIVNCNDEDPKKYTCCQGLLYDKPSNESMCCEGIRKDIPAEGIPDGCQPSLCGNKMYDSSYNICCNDKLINRTKYCCKDGKQFKLFNFVDGLYTKNIQICGQYAMKRSRNVGCCIGMPYFKRKIKCPLMWRDKRSELKSSDYPFWNIIHCKTLNMTGTILHAKQISHNKFMIDFKSQDKNYEVKIHIKNSSKKKELRKNNANKQIYVFYEKISGNKIILGSFGAISFVENHSIKKIDKTKCQHFEDYRKEMNI